MSSGIGAKSRLISISTIVRAAPFSSSFFFTLPMFTPGHPDVGLLRERRGLGERRT